jgi:lipid-binding SYLF domain-containing protein
MPKRIRTPLILLFALSLTLVNAFSAKAASDEQELVDTAKYTMERLLTDEVFSQVPAYLEKAKAVLIVPSMFKAGFFFGAEGGSGVLLSKGAEGEWSYPAFYTIGGASFGLQIGAENSEVLFVILTDSGLESILKTSVKLGADASIAIGPVGAGIEGATTTSFGADIVVFSRSVGLFGGVAGEGSLIYGRESWNENYYGEGATARKIVQKGGVQNENADALRAVLSGK